MIAAILHLGNVTVGGSRSDQAHLAEPAQLEVVCHLLGLRDPSVLHNALVRPKVKAGREWVTQARTAKQVTDELAALSKSLYEKLFGAIVERINRALGRPATRTFIGVLDIAGFEIFETNGAPSSPFPCLPLLTDLFSGEQASSSSSSTSRTRFARRCWTP